MASAVETSSAVRGLPEVHARQAITPDASPQSSLRQKILRESKTFARQKNRRQYAKAPKYPGMATLDDKLDELPYWSCKRRAVEPDRGSSKCAVNNLETSGDHTNEVPEVEPEICNVIERIYVEELWRHHSSDSSPQSGFAHSAYPVSDISNNTVEENSGLPDISISLDRIPQARSLEPKDQWTSTLALLGETQQMYIDLLNLERNFKWEHRYCCSRSGSAESQAVLSKAEELWLSYLDFFQAINHPSAPDGLRSIAAKYNLADVACQRAMTKPLSLMQHQSQDSWGQVISYIHRLQNSLNQLHEDIPSMSDDWNSISYNLGQYTQRLSKEGFDIPEDDLYRPCTAWSVGCGSMSATSMADRPHSRPPPKPPETIQLFYGSGVQPLKDSVLCFLAGWLSHGSSIAPNLYEYYKTFKFMSWIGASL